MQNAKKKSLQFDGKEKEKQKQTDQRKTKDERKIRWKRKTTKQQQKLNSFGMIFKVVFQPNAYFNVGPPIHFNWKSPFICQLKSDWIFNEIRIAKLFLATDSAQK